MKARNFFMLIGVIVMIVLACEDVIQLTSEDLNNTKSTNDSITQPPCDTCDINPPSDSSDVEPPDSDTTIAPEWNSDCDSVGGLWICGIDDAGYFNYNLLFAEWRLIREIIHHPSGDPIINEYEYETSSYILEINEGNLYTLHEGANTQSGTWEAYPDMNNQIWFYDSEGSLTKYYIIDLNPSSVADDMYIFRMATLDKEQIVIIDREFEGRLIY